VRVAIGIALWGVCGCASFQAQSDDLQQPVPVIECPSNEQAGGASSRPGVSIPVPLDGRMAGQLAYYRSERSPGVYAPRGWQCHGWDGLNGTILVVTPKSLQPPFVPLPVVSGPAIAIETSDAAGPGRFHVAIVAAQVFALIGEDFITRIRQEHLIPDASFEAEPDADDQIQNISDRLVEFTTPPNRSGLGTNDMFEPSDWPVRGLIILNLPSELNSLTEVRVRLPPGMIGIAATVVQLETTCIQLQGGCRGLPP